METSDPHFHFIDLSYSDCDNLPFSVAINVFVLIPSRVFVKSTLLTLD